MSNLPAFQRSSGGVRDIPEYREIRDAAAKAELVSSGMRLVRMDTTQRMSIEIARFSSYLVARIRAAPTVTVWERKTPSSRRRFMLVFVDQGAARVAIAESWVSIGPKQFLLIEPGGEFVTLEANSNVDGIIFTFDAREIEPLDHPLRTMREPSRNPSIVSGVVVLLQKITGLGSRQDFFTESDLRELLRVLARTVVHGLSRDPALYTRDVANRALAVIRRRFAELSFSGQALADALGVSVRTVDRALASRGTSVAASIRVLRAEHARNMIRANLPLNLDEIAARSGFRSADTMRRALKRQYNRSPRQLRSVQSSLQTQQEDH